MPIVTSGQVQRTFVSQYGIHVKLDWVEHVLRNFIYNGQQENLSIDQACQQIFHQFLFSDLNLIGGRCLPDDIKSWHNAVLRGRYVLQIEEVVNIAAPAKERYGCQGLPQHQPSYVASSSVNHRCLKLLLTDGVRQVSGIEYRPLGAAINWDCPAGAKLLLSEVPVRRGLLMIQPENAALLGGQVDALEEARRRAVTAWNRPPVARPQGESARDIIQEARAAAWQAGTGSSSDRGSSSSGAGLVPSAPEPRTQVASGENPGQGGGSANGGNNVNGGNVNVVGGNFSGGNNGGFVVNSNINTVTNNFGGNGGSTLSSRQNSEDSAAAAPRISARSLGSDGGNPNGGGAPLRNSTSAATLAYDSATHSYDTSATHVYDGQRAAAASASAASAAAAANDVSGRYDGDDGGVMISLNARLDARSSNARVTGPGSTPGYDHPPIGPGRQGFPHPSSTTFGPGQETPAAPFPPSSCFPSSSSLSSLPSSSSLPLSSSSLPSLSSSLTDFSKDKKRNIPFGAIGDRWPSRPESHLEEGGPPRPDAFPKPSSSLPPRPAAGLSRCDATDWIDLSQEPSSRPPPMAAARNVSYGRGSGRGSGSGEGDSDGPSTYYGGSGGYYGGYTTASGGGDGSSGGGRDYNSIGASTTDGARGAVGATANNSCTGMTRTNEHVNSNADTDDTHVFIDLDVLDRWDDYDDGGVAAYDMVRIDDDDEDDGGADANNRNRNGNGADAAGNGIKKDSSGSGGSEGKVNDWKEAAVVKGADEIISLENTVAVRSGRKREAELSPERPSPSSISRPRRSEAATSTAQANTHTALLPPPSLTTTNPSPPTGRTGVRHGQAMSYFGSSDDDDGEIEAFEQLLARLEASTRHGVPSSSDSPTPFPSSSGAPVHAGSSPHASINVGSSSGAANWNHHESPRSPTPRGGGDGIGGEEVSTNNNNNNNNDNHLVADLNGAGDRGMIIGDDFAGNEGGRGRSHSPGPHATTTFKTATAVTDADVLDLSGKFPNGSLAGSGACGGGGQPTSPSPLDPEVFPTSEKTRPGCVSSSPSLPTPSLTPKRLPRDPLPVPLVLLRDCVNIRLLSRKVSHFLSSSSRTSSSSSVALPDIGLSKSAEDVSGGPRTFIQVDFPFEVRILGVFSEATSHTAWIEDGSGILMAEVSNELAKDLSGMDFQQLLDWINASDGDAAKAAAANAAAHRLMAALRTFSGEMTLHFAAEDESPLLIALREDGRGPVAAAAVNTETSRAISSVVLPSASQAVSPQVVSLQSTSSQSVSSQDALQPGSSGESPTTPTMFGSLSDNKGGDDKGDDDEGRPSGRLLGGSDGDVACTTKDHREFEWMAARIEEMELWITAMESFEAQGQTGSD